MRRRFASEALRETGRFICFAAKRPCIVAAQLRFAAEWLFFVAGGLRLAGEGLSPHIAARSTGVSFRKLAPPGVGVRDHVFEAVLGFPAEHAAGEVVGCDEARGVAGPARADGVWDGADDLFDGRDDLADAMAFAGPEIDDGRAIAFEGGEVGFGEVGDVDVVANAGSVRGRVVVSEDGEGRPESHGGEDGEGDEVLFGFVVFAEVAVGVGPGCVEVPEGDGFDSVGLGVAVEEPLDDEFGFAVGAFGACGVAFGDGDAVRLAIDGRAAAEDDLFELVFGEVEELDGAVDVVPVVLVGVLDALPDADGAREEHEVGGPVVEECEFDVAPVGDVALAEGAVDDGGAVSCAEIVEDDVIDAPFFEELCDVGADEPGASND